MSGRIRELPGNYETSAAVLSQMQQDVQFGRPFDYAASLAGRYLTMDAAALDAAFRSAIDPNAFTWVIVGDKAKVLPQLRSLKMAITVVDTPAG
jgi:predicted Zn-dependent peptidase